MKTQGTIQVQATPTMPLSRATGAVLQRQCACGQHKPGGGECEDCKKKRAPLQRHPSGHAEPSAVPPIVYDVLRSPGQPLDRATRNFMEPRFGHDFSQVRVHTDSRAAESAREVNALAYTVGPDIVFGAGQYGGHSRNEQALIAHELAHVVQQGNQRQWSNELRLGSADDMHEREASNVARGVASSFGTPKETMGSAISSKGATHAPGFVRRACLAAKDCAAPRATLTTFVEQTEKDPVNVSKAAKRKTACTKKPRNPACTSDGHGAPATSLKAIMKSDYPSRLGFVTGIYVDKDMPSAYGAYTTDCSAFIPPLPGGKCTFVPDTLEAQAKLFRRGARAVAGQSRQDWLASTISTLTHETEHARFDTAAPIPRLSPTSCKFEDFESNLSELAANLSEMHVYYRDALARPEKNRYRLFYSKFDEWVKNGAEDISGIVKDLRCKCECADANRFITKTAESVSTSQKWDSNEKTVIHSELKDRKWGLAWPVNPPAAIDVNDLPTVKPEPLKFE